MRYRKNIDNIGYIDIYGKKKTQFTCHFVIVHAQKAYAHVNKKNKRKKSQSAGIWEDQLHWTGLFGRVICYDVCDFWSSWSGARLSTTSMIVGWEDFSVTVTGSNLFGCWVKKLVSSFCLRSCTPSDDSILNATLDLSCFWPWFSPFSY